jgi:hypothetical protein
VACPPATEKKNVPAPALQQEIGQSVQTLHIKSQPLDNILRVVTVAQQIMTELSGAVSEEDKIVNHYILLNLMKQKGI